MSSSLAEAEVLKPKDPSIANSDDWEEFELTNVEIRNFQTGELKSLLHAHPYSPVTVTGRLAAVKRHQEKYLVQRTSLSKNPSIEIPGTAQHSWGQYESGETVFWVEGQAGWFLITPARSYKEIYEEMVEAAKLLFFTADIHSQAKKKGPSSYLLFQECSEDDRFPCETHEEAIELYHKHRHFLIMAMLDGKEGVNWKPTPIFDYFMSTYPEEVAGLIEQRNGQSGTGSKPKKSASIPAKHQSSKISGEPKKDQNWWKAKVLWSLIQRCLAQGSIEEEDMTIANFARILVKRYEISDENQASNLIRFQAQNLRFMIEKKHESVRNRVGVQWLKLPIYSELAYTQLPASTIRMISEIELRPRRVPLDDSDVESESSLESHTARTRRLRGGKSSALRPKGTKSSKKVVGRRKGKYYHRISQLHNHANQMEIDKDADDDEDMRTVGLDDIIPDNGAGKRRSQEDPTDTRPRKRGSSAAPDNPLTPATTAAYSSSSPSDVDSDPDDDGVLKTEPLPLRWKQPRKGNNEPSSDVTFLPNIISRPLPSTAPNAPGDVFACPFDGCVHRVYNASADDSQVLIKDHIRKHQSSQQEQLNLVRDAEQRSHLPVSNLINRIRQIADLQQDVHQSPLAQGESSASALLQQIQRKY